MDRENVIKGLENCITGFDCPPECPYLDDCNDLMKPMFVELAKDTLALLKEQEAKTGHWLLPEDEGCLIFAPEVYVQCSICGKKAQYGHKDKYCRHCGAKMES